MTAFNKQMEMLLVASEFQDLDLPPSIHQCGPLAALLDNVIMYCVSLRKRFKKPVFLSTFLQPINGGKHSILNFIYETILLSCFSYLLFGLDTNKNA